MLYWFNYKHFANNHCNHFYVLGGKVLTANNETFFPDMHHAPAWLAGTSMQMSLCTISFLSPITPQLAKCACPRHLIIACVFFTCHFVFHVCSVVLVQLIPVEAVSKLSNLIAKDKTRQWKEIVLDSGEMETMSVPAKPADWIGLKIPISTKYVPIFLKSKHASFYKLILG